MNTQSLDNMMPPQKNVVTLEKGMEWTNNWREAVKQLYNYNESEVPHGFVVPFEDIYELAKDYSDRNIAGVRIYFTLKKAEDPNAPLTDMISAILVPVTKEMHGQEEIFKDILVEVPVASPNIQESAYSIYDVTRPCPPCCDIESPLM